MGSAVRFADVLASKLEQDSTTGTVSRGRTACHTIPTPILLFFSPGGNPAPIPAARLEGAYGERCRPRPFVAPVAMPAPRLRRNLSERQQRALEQLNQLGARLMPDFTDRELRSAFRTLARRFHPDRHPGASEFEVARLSRQFGLLHDAYRLLMNLSPLKPAA